MNTGQCIRVLVIWREIDGDAESCDMPEGKGARADALFCSVLRDRSCKGALNRVSSMKKHL